MASSSMSCSSGTSSSGAETSWPLSLSHSFTRSQGCDRLVLLASCSSEEGHQPCTALRSAELSEHGTLWASHRKLREISVNATWPGRFRNWLYCTPMLSVRPGRQDGPGVRKWLWKECGCSSALSQTEALGITMPGVFFGPYSGTCHTLLTRDATFPTSDPHCPIHRPRALAEQFESRCSVHWGCARAQQGSGRCRHRHYPRAEAAEASPFQVQPKPLSPKTARKRHGGNVNKSPEASLSPS